MKLIIVPIIPKDPKKDPSITLNTINTTTPMIAFTYEESSIPANLAPIHRNMADINIKTIKPMMLIFHIPPIVIVFNIFSPCYIIITSI